MAGKICFIGAGKMAEALIKGILGSGAAKARDIIASDISTIRTRTLRKVYRISTVRDNVSAVKGAGTVILSVKPQNMASVIGGIKKGLRRGQLVISIAAGIKLKSIESALPGMAVIRAMPNNPALIGEGVTALSFGRLAKKPHRRAAEGIFASVGDVVNVAEKDMDAVTALSGSGPAFVYSAISSMIKGGIDAGLNASISEKLALKTVLGAVKTVIVTGKTPEELIRMVASPGGTTIAGLKVLDKNKFGKTLRKAIMNASIRARALSRQNKI